MKKITLLIILFIYFLIPLNINAEENLDVVSDYIYLYDMETKQVLMDKNSKEKIFPASMTKMMTLIVALENINDLQERVTITSAMLENLKESNATVAGFSVNENPKIIDLMYGVMLPSGADCTNALAYHISGSIDGFVSLMNAKAKQLNMNDTNFVNTTGLHDDNHYTTLYDLSLLLNYCYQNETFKQIFSTDKYISSSTNINPNGILMNSTVFKHINNENSKYNVKIDGFIGGKTGYTNKARYCLASVVEKDGVIYGLINAHAWINRETPSNAIDAGVIYNYFINNYSKITIYNKDDTLKTIPVYYSFKDNKVNIKIKDDIKRVIKNDENYEVNIDLPDKLYADVYLDKPIGTINIIYNNTILYKDNLYPEKTIKKDLIAYILINIYWFILDNLIQIILLLTFIIILLLTIQYIKIKRKRLKKRKRKRKSIVNYN